MEKHVGSQAILCGVSCEQGGIGTGFSLRASGFPLSVLFPLRTITHYILLSSHTDDTQGDSGERVDIFGGDSIDHCEKKIYYEYMPHSKCLPRYSCLNLQIQKSYKW